MRIPSGRYLYERLGEKGFQQLCSALLAHEFPDVTCMPVGQRDGGRDAVRKSAAPLVVYQVKWTSDALRDPVSWLNAAIKKEADNIRRLVTEGAESYYLMTSVAGTSNPRHGTMDRLDKALAKHAADLGIAMQCWWRTDIDARVDKAPDAIKWSYADMLAGWDLVRYLIHADTLASRDRALRDLVLKVIATQWDEDAKVKFKQVDLDSHALADLFIDVEAERIADPLAVRGRQLTLFEENALGGAAEYLVGTKQPLTLVRGAPGQGKSTLAQYICQAHRAKFLSSSVYLIHDSQFDVSVTQPRVPVRIDLRDYAYWLSGADPFTAPDPGASRTRRRRRHVSMESFIARLFEAKSGDLDVTATMVSDILERFPVLLVLDGLDEVAQHETRTAVVDHINGFCARLGTGTVTPQVVVTTRPNSSDLPEPSPDRFETIALQPLSPQLRSTYLDKWADARGLSTDDRASLKRIFEARSVEPHIARLAENPMQQTILLYLIQKRGDSIPHARTDLYRSYMETFLDREAAKSAAVHKHRDNLEEVTAYLGWHLQSLTEATDTNGQLPVKSIKEAILRYLFAANKDVTLVDELFTAVTDRVWALSSKEQGTFQFDVQPVQEYFAAKHLYEVAGADKRGFDGSEVFRHLVRRPYWLNTCRFYAGFAKVNELVALAEVLEDEFRSSLRPAHIRTAAWTLLADGVFFARPKTQERVARLFDDDLSVALITHALDTNQDIAPLPADRGGITLAQNLYDTITDRPDHPLSPVRARLAAQLSPDHQSFDAWWQPHMQQAIGTDTEAGWLRVGAASHAAGRLPAEYLTKLTLADPAAAEAALDAGACPPPDSDLERALVRAVLDGQCSDAEPAGHGLPADLVRLLAPQHFLRRAKQQSTDLFSTADQPSLAVGHRDKALGNNFRQATLNRIKDRDPRFAHVQKAMQISKGQKGTTSPWGNTARAIAEIYGPCWLAAEIAIIGAASSTEHIKTGGDLTHGAQPLGSAADYGQLLRDVRLQRSKPAWWKTQFHTHGDALSRCTWAFALVAVAHNAVVLECLELLDQTTACLPPSLLRALLLSSSRLGSSGLGRRLNHTTLNNLENCNNATALLIAHHATTLQEEDSLPAIQEHRLIAIAETAIVGWPATRAITARILADPTPSLLQGPRASGPRPNLGVGPVSQHLSPEYMTAILADAGAFPRTWVLAADQTASRSQQEPTLAEVAKTNTWFT